MRARPRARGPHTMPDDPRNPAGDERARGEHDAAPPPAPSAPSPADPHEGETLAPTSELRSELFRAHAALPYAHVPHMLGRYRIVRLIGSGGMGEVYEAEQEEPRRRVAVKMVRGGARGARALRRFARESQILSQLSHPAVAQVFDAGSVTDAGGQVVPYFVMELVPGARSLTRHAREAGLDARRRIELFSDACRGVAHGHARRIIHRDLKPGNILVDREGRVKVIDFGVARALGTDGGARGSSSDTASTETGQVLGTLAYMSPEQVAGQSRHVDERSDVYSLGVVLYELLCGRMPVDLDGVGIIEAARRIRETEPVPPAEIMPDLNADVSRVVMTALAKEPARRYESAGELADDLDRCLRGETIRARGASGWYRARSGARRALGRYWQFSLVGVVLACTVAAQWIAPPLVFGPTGFNEWFQRVASAAGVDEPFRNVRVIGLTDPEAIGDLAKEAGLEHVEPGNLRSWRRLHGALMEKLARAGARVVAWDVVFGLRSDPPTEFDADFVRGIEALRAAGCDTVLACPEWSIDERGLPNVSPIISRAARWGAITAFLGKDAPWRVDAVVRRPDRSAMASLSVEAAAAYHQPGSEADFGVDEGRMRVDVAFYTRTSAPEGRRAPVGSTRSFPLSHVGVEQESGDIFGVERGSLVGSMMVQIPPDSDLGAATLDYAQALRMDDAALRARIAGKAVVIGYCFEGAGEAHALPDGRVRPACYAHAAALELILAHSAVRLPSEAQGWLATLLGAGAGALLSAWGMGSRAVRVTLLLGLAAATVLACVGVYRSTLFLCNPGVPLAACVSACAASAWVMRARPW
ncbi:MAG: protein kinase [Phycisphaerae bacterium]|nr:protein kinase [Phycisphaerae bacterium]